MSAFRGVPLSPSLGVGRMGQFLSLPNGTLGTDGTREQTRHQRERGLRGREPCEFRTAHFLQRGTPRVSNRPLANPMEEAVPRGAKTRAVTPCRRHTMAGKRWYRLHDGAPGSEAPEAGRTDNYRHGRFSRSRIAERIARANTPWKLLPPPSSRAWAREEGQSNTAEAVTQHITIDPPKLRVIAGGKP